MSNIDLKRRTKIVATIGPATQSEEIITDLIKAGVTTFRLNFSHGDHKDHSERIKTIREVSKKLAIKKELGDVLWYVSNLCTELNFNLEDVALQNLEKLKLRAAKGKIRGSGDDR